MMIMTGPYTPGQKANYLRFACGRKGQAVSYDPVTISIVATGRCTLSCDMCPTHSVVVPRDYPHRQSNARDIDIAMFRHIIDRFRNATTVQIIGSGEPLLNKDFFKMVEYAVGRNMTVKTFSNGTTIGDNVDAILGSGLNGITISINGHNAKEYRRMTGMDESVYHKIYDGVKRLIEEKRRRNSKVKVKLSFIIDRHNYKSIPEMVDCGLKLGADHMFFCNFLSTPYGDLNADKRILMNDGKTADEVRAIFAGYSRDVRRKLTPPILVDKGLGKNQCDAHFSQIRFDGDGNISSCSMMLLNMQGNGSYKDEDVWNNGFFRKMRALFLANDDKALPEPCRVCPDNKGVSI